MSWNGSAMCSGRIIRYALMTANGLGADLRALGEFQEALASDRETYESFKEQFGEDYPRTLIAAHNLACSLRLVGDCFAARAVSIEETLDRQRQVLAPDHPYTLYTAANLAHDMRAAGAFRESVDLLRVTLGGVPGGPRRRHDRHPPRPRPAWPSRCARRASSPRR